MVSVIQQVYMIMQEFIGINSILLLCISFDGNYNSNNKSQCTSNTLHYYIGSDTGYKFVCYDNDKTMHIYL